jgi:O-antigen ligase
VVHNLYLLVGGELGIPGLIAFLGMFFAVFYVALHWATRVDTWQSGVLIGITAGLMAQMIHGLFDPGFKILMNLSTLVYAMFGVVGAVSIMGRKGEAFSNQYLQTQR